MHTIRTKLAVLVVTAVGSAVLLVASFLTWSEVQRSFAGKRIELQGVATAIATSVSKPLAHRDEVEVARTLGAVGRLPGLTFARVTDAGGRHLVQFGFGVVVTRDAEPIEANPPLGPLSAFYLATYPVKTPIIHSGEAIGELTLIADVSGLRAEAIQSLKAALGAGLLAVAFGLLLSWRLQSAIAQPLAQLTATIQDVSRTKDFERKVGGGSNDEIGILIGAFNEMLGEIRARDGSLAAHRGRLEIEVQERTAELGEAKLAAEAASAAKSDFLATMSHEIRTPLNGMLVMAELMAAARLEPKLQRYSQVLLNSGQTLLAIINDILDCRKSKPESWNSKAFRCASIAASETSCSFSRPRQQNATSRIVSVVAEDVPAVIAADPVRITQVLSNLVNNALKFTMKGSVTIRVAATGDTEAPVLRD